VADALAAGGTAVLDAALQAAWGLLAPGGELGDGVADAARRGAAAAWDARDVESGADRGG
jgi:hypothetical protein